MEWTVTGLIGIETANLSKTENWRSMNCYAAVVHGAQRTERKWEGSKSSQPDHYGVSLTGVVECRGRLDVGYSRETNFRHLEDA